jgi:hypothetical protein
LEYEAKAAEHEEKALQHEAKGDEHLLDHGTEECEKGDAEIRKKFREAKEKLAKEVEECNEKALKEDFDSTFTDAIVDAEEAAALQIRRCRNVEIRRLRAACAE